MPELPEVETTLQGILPYLLQQKIRQVIVRHPRLRWPIPNNLPAILKNQTVTAASRRGKYILINTPKGTLILHLGMSGSLRILKENIPPRKHDHVDIEFAHQVTLRLTDPRRFGALLWTEDPPQEHTLLKNLGPEPLSPEFTGQTLWRNAQQSKRPIKTFIMDSIVVGVGNIYANEALFAAGINPHTLASTLTKAACTKLVTEIKKVLKAAIKKGGTTLKDFSHGEGKPGYFKQQLKVYGRGGLPCVTCKTLLKEDRLGQRSTVHCLKCQS